MTDWTRSQPARLLTRLLPQAASSALSPPPAAVIKAGVSHRFLHWTRFAVCPGIKRRSRELEHDRQAAAWRFLQPYRAAVGGDKPVHDGQAEAGAAGAAAGEPQERAGPLLRGHPGAVVGDGRGPRGRGAGHRHGDDAPAVADRGHRVVEQVVEDLLQVPGAERDQRVAGLLGAGYARHVHRELHVVAVGHRLPGRGPLRDRRRHVDALKLLGHALRAGGGEQPVDQPGQPGDLFLRPGELLGVGGRGVPRRAGQGAAAARSAGVRS